MTGRSRGPSPRAVLALIMAPVASIAVAFPNAYEPNPLGLKPSLELEFSPRKSPLDTPKPLPNVLVAQVGAGRALLQLAQSDAIAAPPVEGGGALRFEIRRYNVDGNTLLSKEDIDRTVAPFIGPQKDFGDVQRALEALQAAYAAKGYAGVQITLPEQELDRGEVRFAVIENKIGKIVVEGNEHFNEANVRRTVPTLVPGTTPNSRTIASSVRLANENPAKQTAVLLRASETEGEVDAVIRVADVSPVKYSISVDNTGNTNTGLYRVGVAMQHANVLNRDHVFTAQYLTSPQNPNNVTVLGTGYRIPFYSTGDSLDLVAGYSDVDSGTVQDLFTVTGKGSIYALRYNHALPKWKEIEHKLVYGADYRAYQNNVLPVTGGPNIVPDISIRPISATYSGTLRDTASELGYYLSYTRNIPGGNDGQDVHFKAARAEARAAYRVWRFGGSYSRTLPQDWQMRVAFNAQYTQEALISGEQFGLGGTDSVRGFNERYASSDKGYRANVEVYTPDVAAQWGIENSRLRFLAFYDGGTAHRNRVQVGELKHVSLDSAGVGFRLNYRKDFSVRGDYAQVIHDGTQNLVPAGRTHANRWHTSFAYVF